MNREDRLLDQADLSLEEANDVVRSLLKTLDRHSTGERAHAERVAVYSVATGDVLNLSDSELRLLRYASQLHDVGKVRVDGRLLSKMGSLSDSEFLSIKLHSELAFEVLSEFRFLASSLPLIRHHHERWDGLGYPNGLIGEACPLGARIIAVAESFDAMTFPARRSVRKSPEQALDELRSQASRQFDPTVVDAFIQAQQIIQPVGL